MSFEPGISIQSVLLVAGDASVRRLAEDALGATYRLQIVSTVEDAREAGARCDLALIDVPSGELVEACRDLRRLTASGGPIPILAAVEEDDAERVSTGLGPDEVLIKPLRRADLRLRVRALLALHRMREGQRHLAMERQDLVALFVHDLKSPLSAVFLNASMLAREQALSERARRCAQRITDATYNMRRMVLNLLDVSRAEGSPLKPQLADVDPAQIVTDVISSMTTRAASSEHRIEFAPPAAPMVIGSDAELLRRVLDNLLDNALSYSPSKTAIVVELEPMGDTLELRVRDQGPGIPAALRERIFDKRASGASEGHFESAGQHGLGLAFCRLAVEALRGQICVLSNEPSGSVFCVRHPIHQPSATAFVIADGTATRTVP